ncbi:BTAD domain-containing putative transcriptional regulator [Micromonospora sp. NPDC049366]|uniref:BTAD domain-containing putative transcriptional regulator n=1 Tax=Micromonospora sp. NPDC049366 TaxID=3364271 RepID=UPI0037AF457C
MLLRVLGPFEAESDGGDAVVLGGPRQRAVLAMLLLARGEVVSVDRLVEQLWQGEAPPRALASLQAYVSNLRRLLEPDREPRAPARLLVTAPPGYAVRLPDGAVDAWRFETLLAEARAARADDPERARHLLDTALGLWRGPAYAEFAEQPWAQPEVNRLEELRFVARELLLDVRLGVGDAAGAVAEAEAMTRQFPLREESWRLLALALWRTGRQGDALAALRRARTVLVEELGLDPGPALVALEAAILHQRHDVLLPAPPPPGARVAARPSAPSPGPPAPVEPDEVFVGRDAELALLRRTAASAAVDGPRVAVVSGEAGAGKTSLLAHLRRELVSAGWTALAGRCPEVEGAPPAWAWVEVLRQLAATAPPGDLAPALAPLLDDTGRDPAGDVTAGRFRLHRAVAAWLCAAAAERPLAVLLDDLHAADSETLLLLTTAVELTDAAVLFVVALRPGDNRERLAATMAALARRSPERLHLGGLTEPDVERLVDSVARTRVDPDTVAALTVRTGGNPFYLRESARLLAAEGALVATSEVPEGVRDVLRRRLSRLPENAVTLLRLAAVAGREADVAILVAAADGDEGAVLDALDVGIVAGLLTEPAPGRVRFPHDLVRDTIYTDLSHLRRARLHARVADATRALRPDDHSALAHHYARAASPDTARLAVDYAVRAAELAERRYAHDVAADLLTHALATADTVAGDRAALRIDLLGRLLRAQARAGALAAARDTRDRAVDHAVEVGRDELLIAAFTAWTVPTPWAIRAYGVVDHRIVDLLTRLLRRRDLTPVDRCRLLEALSGELDGEADPRGFEAGREALAISRELADPELRALGLAARLRTMRHDREAAHRRELARELGELAYEHGLPTYDWLAEQVLCQTSAALNEPRAVRASVARQETLAAAYQLNDALVIALGARGALAHVCGDFGTAQRRYDESADLLRRQGSLHADAFHYFATASLLISQGRLAEHLEPTRRARTVFGPIIDDLLALALIENGRVEEARTIPVGTYPHRPDYFQSALLTVRAMTLVALDRVDLTQPVVDALLPVREQLAGFSSSTIAMRPVALTLGELFRLRGDTDEAARHFALAVDVARRWGSPHWLAEARAALAR